MVTSNADVVPIVYEEDGEEENHMSNQSYHTVPGKGLRKKSTGVSNGTHQRVGDKTTTESSKLLNKDSLRERD